MIAASYVIIDEQKEEEKRRQLWVKKWVLHIFRLGANFTLRHELIKDFLIFIVYKYNKLILLINDCLDVLSLWTDVRLKLMPHDINDL